MADQQTLKKLLEVANNSLVFAGMKEEDVWQACLAYQDRSNEEVEQAMEKIKAKDDGMKAEQAEKENKLKVIQEKKVQLREGEKKERQEDLKKAEELLKELFKK
jgi:pyruvate/2-oxoacid:ferredoxin oxidoreductase beta subunit